MKLVPITQVDRRVIEDFTCLFPKYEKHQQQLKKDHEEIDEYLKEKALKNHLNNLVRTHLLLNETENKVIGFFSLFNDSCFISNKKEKNLKFKQFEINRGEGITDLPSIHLHKFAIHQSYQGKSFGGMKFSDYLLSCVFDTVVAVTTLSGCMLIILEATDNAFAYYQHRGFKVLNKKSGNTLPLMIFKVNDIPNC